MSQQIDQFPIVSINSTQSITPLITFGPISIASLSYILTANGQVFMNGPPVNTVHHPFHSTLWEFSFRIHDGALRNHYYVLVTKTEKSPMNHDTSIDRMHMPFHSIHYSCQACESLESLTQDHLSNLVKIYCHPAKYEDACSLLGSRAELLEIVQTTKLPFYSNGYLLPSFIFENERIKCMDCHHGESSIMAFVTESNNIYVFGIDGLVGRSIYLRHGYYSEKRMACQLRPPKSVFKHSSVVSKDRSSLDPKNHHDDGACFMTSDHFQIESIKCGTRVIVLQCKNKEIFVAGDNSMRCIGLDAPSFYGILTSLRFSKSAHQVLRNEMHISQIVCGQSFVAYLTENGNVFYTGSLEKKYSEKIERLNILGVMRNHESDTYNEIQDTNDHSSKVKKISCWGKALACLMSDRKTVNYIVSGLKMKRIQMECCEPIEDLCCCGEDSLRVLLTCHDSQCLKSVGLAFSENGISSFASHALASHNNKMMTIRYQENISTIREFQPKETELSKFTLGKVVKLTQEGHAYFQSHSLICTIESKDLQIMKRNLSKVLRVHFQSDIDIVVEEGLCSAFWMKPSRCNHSIR
ncbi:hypothetical protein C9374_003890 [Naegleria lovaniensis]|uniref:Uncharacterized protein n=1 Tax=Naegleria lovaniensis TaxID=51637 RepID=A0AA88H5T6_NAELO|nr:uncharacterized protein C9374_003890 [Naegleria lovaniensis]KAG2394126.1 hypothetical protein C9374_003890 [Naegleria lovaniensis]